MQWSLEKEPAQYILMKTIARTLIIPSHEKQIIQENLFNNAPVRRIAVAMKKNQLLHDFFHGNHFSYQQFHLRELRIIRG